MQEKIYEWESVALMKKMEELAIPSGVVKNLATVFSESAARKLIRSEDIGGILTQRVSSIAFNYED